MLREVFHIIYDIVILIVNHRFNFNIIFYQFKVPSAG